MENQQLSSPKLGFRFSVCFGEKITITDSNFVSVELTEEEGGELLAALFEHFSDELARSRKGSAG